MGKTNAKTLTLSNSKSASAFLLFEKKSPFILHCTRSLSSYHMHSAGNSVGSFWNNCIIQISTASS